MPGKGIETHKTNDGPELGHAILQWPWLYNKTSQGQEIIRNRECMLIQEWHGINSAKWSFRLKALKSLKIQSGKFHVSPVTLTFRINTTWSQQPEGQRPPTGAKTHPNSKLIPNTSLPMTIMTAFTDIHRLTTCDTCDTCGLCRAVDSCLNSMSLTVDRRCTNTINTGNRPMFSASRRLVKHHSTPLGSVQRWPVELQFASATLGVKNQPGNPDRSISSELSLHGWSRYKDVQSLA